MQVKSKSGRVFDVPTGEEAKAIHEGALSDPDAQPLTDDEWTKIKPTLRGGRPMVEKPKKTISIRLSDEVLSYFKSTGKGWQTRMNEVLEKYVALHR